MAADVEEVVVAADRPFQLGLPRCRRRGARRRRPAAPRSAAPSPATTSSSDGSALRSTLPLGVSGIASSGTITDGTITSGSTAATCLRSSSDETIDAVARQHEADELDVGGGPAGDDDRLGDVGVAVEHGLDLTELDAVTADLHLVVGAPGELDVAGRVDAGQVAGGVDASRCRAARRSARR